MSIMRNVAVGSTVGLVMCASAAVAQDRQRTQQPDRERTNQYDNQDRDRNRLQDRDRFQDGNQQFGQIRDVSSPLAQIGDLSGMWEMQVTFYGDDDDENARGVRTANGIAERRWILDGTVMMERYSLAGGSQSMLPLNELGQSNMRGTQQFDRQQDPNRTGQDRPTPGATDRDRDRDPNRDINRDPNRDLDRDPNRQIQRDQDQTREPNRRTTDRDQIDRQQDRRNINDPDRNRLARTGQMGQPSQGIALWGYEAGSDEFTVVWSDDSTSGLRCDTGELGDDGRMTLTGTYYDPNTEETFDTRVVIDMVSPEMQRLTMYKDAGLLSEEKKHMEIVYRRAGAGTFASPDRQNPTDRQRTPNRRTP